MPVPSVLLPGARRPQTHGSMHDMRKQTQQAEIAGPRQSGLRVGWVWKVVALLGLVLWASGVAPKVLPSNRVRAPGYGIPPPDTGNLLLNWICSVLFMGVHLERRIDPFIRPPIDQYLRDPLSDLITRLINMLRKDEGYQLAEERIQPDEEAHIDDIIASFNASDAQALEPGLISNAAATPRRTASCAPSSPSAMTCRSICGAVFSPSRPRTKRGSATQGPAHMSRPISTTSAS